MNRPSDLLVTHASDSRIIVVLPQHAFAVDALQATRSQLLALADSVVDGALELDFTHVDYLGSDALAVLLTVHRRAALAKGRLALRRLAPYVYELFQLTRLDTVLDVRPADAAE